MSHFSPELRTKAEALVALYPQRRSALIPMCHLAQGQDGYLTEEAMIEVGELCGVTPAEVRDTATFYDMLHTDPVGKYVVGICTNIACMLNGADELLEHAKNRLDCAVGSTTNDGTFTLEETECLADCDVAPCVQVNHRFVRTTTPEALDALLD
ncbi:MAG: NADH-quinone oxidoreductase subunit NuoE, partial [Actinomycetota bacterium]